MLAVGQKVVFSHRREVKTVTVTKVGRKWVTLSNGKRASVERAHFALWYPVDLGGAVYESEEDIALQKRRELEVRRFKDAVAHTLLDPTAVREAAAVLGFNLD